MQERPSPVRTNGDVPVGLVRMAYHQLSLMGLPDPFAPPKEKPEEKPRDVWMVCTRRFFQLPIFLSVSSSVANTYRAVAVSPFADQVVAALETPLKTADNAVCASLGFLEEHVPAIKLPPSQIYERIVDSFRSVLVSTVETLLSIKDQWAQLMANPDGKPKDSIQS